MKQYNDMIKENINKRRKRQKKNVLTLLYYIIGGFLPLRHFRTDEFNSEELVGFF